MEIYLLFLHASEILFNLHYSYALLAHVFLQKILS